MNPLLQAALAAIVRWVLAIGAGWIVSHGIWSASDAEDYVAAAALALVALGWSLYQKWRQSHAIQVALSLPVGSTEADLHREIRRALE